MPFAPQTVPPRPRGAVAVARVESAVEAQFVFVDPAVFGMHMINMTVEGSHHPDGIDTLPKQMTRVEIDPYHIPGNLMQLPKRVRVVDYLPWV